MPARTPRLVAKLKRTKLDPRATLIIILLIVLTVCEQVQNNAIGLGISPWFIALIGTISGILKALIGLFAARALETAARAPSPEQQQLLDMFRRQRTDSSQDTPRDV